MGSALRTERDALAAVPGYGAAASAADEQAAVHDSWESQVARPLIAAPDRADAGALHLRGKALIDRFRAADASIRKQLAAASQAGDRRFVFVLQRIGAFGVVGALLILLATVIINRRIGSSEARAEQQQYLYEHEKRLTDTLQRSFMNATLPAVPGVQLDAVYLPAEEALAVGGDWYEAVPLGDDRIFFSVGDVCGHGIDAAVVMGRARQSMLAASLFTRDPARIMESVNEVLLLQGSPMVTAVCGFVDLKTRELAYSTAGHPPPIVAEPHRPARTLPYAGLPLGALPNRSFAPSKSSSAGARCSCSTPTDSSRSTATSPRANRHCWRRSILP